MHRSEDAVHVEGGFFCSKKPTYIFSLPSRNSMQKGANPISMENFPCQQLVLFKVCMNYARTPSALCARAIFEGGKKFAILLFITQQQMPHEISILLRAVTCASCNASRLTAPQTEGGMTFS